MRLKSELYKKEQDEIIEQIIKILDLENNYVCLRGNLNLPNIKIFPTKCYNI